VGAVSELRYAQKARSRLDGNALRLGSSYFLTDPVSVFIWHAIGRGASIGEIAALVVEEFHGTPPSEQVEDDVYQFLHDLEIEGLVARIGS